MWLNTQHACVSSRQRQEMACRTSTAHIDRSGYSSELALLYDPPIRLSINCYTWYRTMNRPHSADTERPRFEKDSFLTPSHAARAVIHSLFCRRCLQCWTVVAMKRSQTLVGVLVALLALWASLAAGVFPIQLSKGEQQVVQLVHNMTRHTNPPEQPSSAAVLVHLTYTLAACVCWR